MNDARRVARHLGLALTLLFLATAGGRITASDEYTLYRLAESLVTRGAVWVEAGNAERGPAGRLYPKAGIGQALAAAPFYAAGKAAAIPFDGAKEELVTRAITSLLNAFVSGLLGAILFLLFLEVGAAPRGALFWAFATCLATPLWVYAKSFLTEPLLALGLTAGFYGAVRFRATGAPRHALIAGFAWGGTVLVKYALAPAVLLLALPFLPDLRKTRAALPGILAVLLCVLLALVYNATRTGSPLGTGYGRQASASAFSTPLFVGLYGLLLSSGKGIVWFAPAIALAPAGWAEMTRPRQHSNEPRHGVAARNAALAAIATWMVGLLQFGTFQHWAGDGSWGPRYLVPLLPLAFVAVAFALTAATRARRRLAWTLGLAGLLVTVGGVGIHFGAEMRAVGDYPYTLALEDPHFMEASHFNPRFSPIVVHWRMLAQNAASHLRGDLPALGNDGTPDPRLGISPADQAAMLRAIDVWWLYARYAGLPMAPLAVAVLALKLAAIAAWIYALRALRVEGKRPA